MVLEPETTSTRGPWLNDCSAGYEGNEETKSFESMKLQLAKMIFTFEDILGSIFLRNLLIFISAHNGLSPFPSLLDHRPLYGSSLLDGMLSVHNFMSESQSQSAVSI